MVAPPSTCTSPLRAILELSRPVPPVLLWLLVITRFEPLPTSRIAPPSTSIVSIGTSPLVVMLQVTEAGMTARSAAPGTDEGWWPIPSDQLVVMLQSPELPAESKY